MRQITFSNQASFEKYARPSRWEQFLGTMEQVVPRSELEALIGPYYPKAGSGRQPVGLGMAAALFMERLLSGVRESGGLSPAPGRLGRNLLFRG